VDFNRETMLKFDVRKISSVGSAKLQLFGRVSDSQDASISTSVFGLADNNWSETAITFNTRPPFGSVIDTKTIAGTALKLYEFDVTAFLLKERSLKHDIVSFVLKNPNSSLSFVTFNSREAADGRPVLRIDASPSVGTFKLAPPSTKATAGESTNLAIEWNVPQGSWRQLRNIQLRLRGRHGASILIEWDEADNTLSLFDPKTGQFGAPMTIGAAGVLSNGLVSVSLASSSVAAIGPTSSKVIVTFSLQFKEPGHWTVETSAGNDLGFHTGFERAGRITIRHWINRRPHFRNAL